MDVTKCLFPRLSDIILCHVQGGLGHMNCCRKVDKLLPANHSVPIPGGSCENYIFDTFVSESRKGCEGIGAM